MKSKFVLAQLDQKGWPEENLANAEKAVAEAVERYQPDMMIFPECFMSHFPTGTDRAVCLGTAQTLDGPFVTGMRKLAADNGIWIIFGMNEKVEDPEDDRNYNCTVVIDDKGEIVSTYRKHISTTRSAIRNPMITNRATSSSNRLIRRLVKLASLYAMRSVSRRWPGTSAPRAQISSLCRLPGCPVRSKAPSSVP